ncbi:response regulator transcription factor [Streptomyces sp. NBC_01142]|uniref:response regulator transcription factor n=1 Tax=Streptomyces sp. NBC_01142 TaxID=2975865 RepID=UPI002259E581|nr:response regulator transcription factor [Streptomyces sp. NBC_01142]MCX4819077.1 response regulator transcription factor [Streptomyces sp. NBC_01142]
MQDDISHSSAQNWTQQSHVSQHTSSHATPLSSDHTTGIPLASAAPVTTDEFPVLPPPGPMPAAPPLRVVVADDNPVVRAGLTVLLQGRADLDVVAEAADGREAYEATVQHRPDVVLLDVRMPGVDGISALPHLVRLAPVLMMTYSRESEIVHEALRLGAGGYLVHGEFTADQLIAAVRDIKLGRVHFTHSASNALLASVRGEGPGDGGPLPDGLGTAFANRQSGHGHSTNQQVAADRPEDTRQQFAQPSSLTQANVSHSSRSPVVAGGLHGVITELSQREVEVMDLIASGMTNQQIAASCFISQKTVKNHINRIFAKLNAGSRGEAIAIWHSVSRGGPGQHG